MSSAGGLGLGVQQVSREESASSEERAGRETWGGQDVSAGKIGHCSLLCY